MDRQQKNKYKRAWMSAFRSVSGTAEQDFEIHEDNTVCSQITISSEMNEAVKQGHVLDMRKTTDSGDDDVEVEETTNCIERKFDWLCGNDNYEIVESSTDSDSGNIDDGELFQHLRTWIADFNVKHNAVDKLLTILKLAGHKLPATARSLLSTVREVPLSQKSGMDYTYLNIKKQLHAYIEQLEQSGTEGIQHVEISLNVDGLPLFKSSNVCVWPVLCAIVNVQPVKVFPTALACGSTKPSNLDFLHDTVEDLRCVMQNGIIVNNRTISVMLRCITCDAPARAMVKGAKLYSGYAGCDKCTQRGKWLGRMTFAEVENLEMRTDVSFRNQSQPEHHHGVSPFCELPVDMVLQFPIDYMHQCCLGVMRKLLLSWLRGKPAVRMSANNASEISRRLIELRRCVPKLFSRKPRSLLEVDRWKATEFRLFLLYIGKLVLKGILRDELYNNFLILSVAMSFLVSPSLARVHHEYAQQLLVCFVSQCRALYGDEFLTYNVHSLVHIAAEVDRFGSLDNCSAFMFENYLQQLKRMVRSGRKPLTQLVKRLSEMPPSEVVGHQATNDLLISAKAPNNAYILHNCKCCEVLSCSDNVSGDEASHQLPDLFTCRVYEHVQPLFTTPCDSRIMETFVVSSTDASIVELERSKFRAQAIMVEVKKSQYCFMAVLHDL